jgi:hypothetical protein
VGGAESPCPLEFAIIDIDRDDRASSGDRCAEDGRVSDATAPDDRDRFAPADGAGVHRGPKPGHHPAAEQPGDLGPHLGIHLRALTGRDQSLGSEGSEPQRRRQRSAVAERHALRGVVSGEAIPRLATQAGATVTADRPPVENHEVAGCDLRDALADRRDNARGFMPEQERELVVDAAFAIVQVGMTNAARLDVDERLARSWVRYDDRGDLDRSTLAPRDDALHFAGHGFVLSPSTSVSSAAAAEQRRPKAS